MDARTLCQFMAMSSACVAVASLMLLIAKLFSPVGDKCSGGPQKRFENSLVATVAPKVAKLDFNSIDASRSGFLGLEKESHTGVLSTHVCLEASVLLVLYPHPLAVVCKWFTSQETIEIQRLLREPLAKKMLAAELICVSHSDIAPLCDGHISADVVNMFQITAETSTCEEILFTSISDCGDYGRFEPSRITENNNIDRMNVAGNIRGPVQSVHESRKIPYELSGKLGAQFDDYLSDNASSFLEDDNHTWDEWADDWEPRWKRVTLQRYQRRIHKLSRGLSRCFRSSRDNNKAAKF